MALSLVPFFFHNSLPLLPPPFRPGHYPRASGRNSSRRLHPVTKAADYIKHVLCDRQLSALLSSCWADSRSVFTPPAGCSWDAASSVTHTHTHTHTHTQQWQWLLLLLTTWLTKTDTTPPTACATLTKTLITTLKRASERRGTAICSEWPKERAISAFKNE